VKKDHLETNDANPLKMMDSLQSIRLALALRPGRSLLKNRYSIQARRKSSTATEATDGCNFEIVDASKKSITFDWVSLETSTIRHVSARHAFLEGSFPF
jgi:hypothetical protein